MQCGVTSLVLLDTCPAEHGHGTRSHGERRASFSSLVTKMRQTILSWPFSGSAKWLPAKELRTHRRRLLSVMAVDALRITASAIVMQRALSSTRGRRLP